MPDFSHVPGKPDATEPDIAAQAAVAVAEPPYNASPAAAQEGTETPPAAPSVPEPGVAPQLPQIAPATIVAASWEALSGKAKRRDKALVTTQDPEGRTVQLEVLFEALGGPEYDKLIDTYPAKPAQQAKGYAYNPDTFPAALLEQTVTQPKLTRDQWASLQKNPNWANGEFGDLFNVAMRTCVAGLNIPFTGLG